MVTRIVSAAVNNIMQDVVRMKGVPEAEQQKIFAAIEKNPDFFNNIAKEIKEKMDSGMDQNDRDGEQEPGEEA